MLNIGINGNVQNLHEQTLFKTKVGLNDRGEKKSCPWLAHLNINML